MVLGRPRGLDDPLLALLVLDEGATMLDLRGLFDRPPPLLTLLGKEEDCNFLLTLLDAAPYAFSSLLKAPFP